MKSKEAYTHSDIYKFGIVSVCVVFFSISTGIGGTIVGGIGLKNKSGWTMVIAGIVMSAIDLLFGLFVVAMALIFGE